VQTNSISKVVAKQRDWAFVQPNLTEFKDISNPCDFICIVLAQMWTVTIVGAELDRRPKKLPAGVILPRALDGMDDTHRAEEFGDCAHFCYMLDRLLRCIARHC
jgi:hypothetical protein